MEYMVSFRVAGPDRDTVEKYIIHELNSGFLYDCEVTSGIFVDDIEDKE